MSRGAGLGLERHHERDFVLSSIEEFVKRFDGKRPINKVNIEYQVASKCGIVIDLIEYIDVDIHLGFNS